MKMIRARTILRVRVGAASSHSLLGLLTGIALTVTAGGAAAQAYSVKPIRVISEFGAGAGGDIF
jgi:tripartite-type tricarboxylate transporter receptor subunit TctC